jgi:hypothetical protein
MTRCNTSSWTKRWTILAAGLLGAMLLGQHAQAQLVAWHSADAQPNAPIVIQIATAKGENPTAAGRAAAESLRQKMGSAPLRAVIVSECFEDKENKEKLLAGICAVLPKQIVLGGATYGSFTQDGCTDADSVCLVGIGGEGIGAAGALVGPMGASKLTFDANRALLEKRLRAAGTALANAIPRRDNARLLILVADAHSPKNQPLVEGLQEKLGKQFPITGGCANKNAGQTFVYFNGQLREDSAVALMLYGDFRVSLSGRQAKENEKVISTAYDGGAEALKKSPGKPIAALAFNCAGRRSKLKSIAEELAAIQKAIGRELPLFGCYCAGEMGPVDQLDKPSDALCGGSGWHIMFTIISR